MAHCTRRLLTLSLLFAFGSPVLAVEENSIPEPVLSLARTLTGSVDASTVRMASVSWLYEVRLRGEFVYVTAGGRFFAHGDFQDARDRRNLTGLSRREDRLEVVDAIDPEPFIVFAHRKAKHTLTVFADVDCPYCAKLHLEVPELNKLGGRVRYAAWPRTPPGTQSYARSVSVWCARDQQKAMTDAKASREIEPVTCENPEQTHFEAGERLGVRGTPTIVTEAGELIGGYVPYPELVQSLERR